MERLFQLIDAPLIWLSGRLAAKPKPGVQAQDAHAIGRSLQANTHGEPVGLHQSDLARHVYALGSTGCGKTNFIMKLLEQDLKRGQSVVVLDLRGDLVDRALSLCRSLDVHAGRVALLDLREKDWIVGFNPLMGDGEPFVRALHLLDVIKTESDSWGVQLEETMRNAFLLLAHASRSVIDLEQLLFDTVFLDDLLLQCDDPAVQGFFERYKGLSEEKQLSWALPVLNKVTPLLATKGLRAVLGSGTALWLDKILETKGSVLLVSLSVDELHRSARMVGSLIVAAICRTMMARVNIPEAKRNPVRLYVDEFENMASDAFEGLIAEGRRFKLSLVLSHQNLSQIPHQLRSAIRNNVGLQVLFGCGFQDAKELERELPEDFSLADLLGLNPGEMLLMPRGGEAKLVKCDLSEVKVSAQDVADYRAEILRTVGTPIGEVMNGISAQRNVNVSLSTLQQPWDLGDSK